MTRSQAPGGSQQQLTVPISRVSGLAPSVKWQRESESERVTQSPLTTQSRARHKAFSQLLLSFPVKSTHNGHTALMIIGFAAMHQFTGRSPQSCFFYGEAVQMATGAPESYSLPRALSTSGAPGASCGIKICERYQHYPVGHLGHPNTLKLQAVCA